VVVLVRPFGSKLSERIGKVDRLACVGFGDRRFQLSAELGSFLRIEKITAVAQDIVGRHQFEACSFGRAVVVFARGRPDLLTAV
jgi:hypothetical protein